MEHAKSYRDENDGSRVRVVFCSVCGKEGLQLAQEPNCPGEFVDNSAPKSKQSKVDVRKFVLDLDNKSEQK